MKTVPLLLLTLFLISLVQALEFQADYDTTVIVKDYNNPIDFTIKITDAKPGTYNLYTLADLTIEPAETFEISGSETFEKSFRLIAQNNLDIKGLYTFDYTLNYREHEKIDKKLTINLVNLEDIIEVSSESISPDKEVEFYIQNMEDVSLKNVTAKFSSILFDEFEKTFDLNPNEKFVISVDADEEKLKKTKAGTYIITSVFETPKGDKKIEGNLFLGEKKGVTQTRDKTGFLIRTETITTTNIGNVVENAQIETTRNIISRLFTSFSLEPTIVERTGLMIKYTWFKEKLDPAETFTITAKTNYILPFFIIIFAIIFIVGLKRYNETKLEITKSVTHVKTKGREFVLKIKLNIKARKNVENLSIIDKVPAIVKIYNKFGNVRPDKIDAASRRLHWNIGDLATKEERNFSYIVYSKVGIVGKFSLPSAKAIFEREGKIHEAESNNVFFLSDQIKGHGK